MLSPLKKPRNNDQFRTMTSSGAMHTPEDPDTQTVVSNFYFPQKEPRLPDYRSGSGKTQTTERKDAIKDSWDHIKRIQKPT